MMKMKAGSLLAAIALSAALAGCGAADKLPAPSNNTGAAASPQETTAPTEAPDTIEAVIYTSDAELLKLTERTETLSYSSNEELVKAAIDALRQSGGENELSLWEKIEINGVKLTADSVTIDVHVPDEARLGAPGEALAIHSLQSTLFQFDFIQSIQLLIDGEKAESLMGHVDLDHPMNRP